MADDFCKEFTLQQEKYMIKSLNGRFVDADASAKLRH